MRQSFVVPEIEVFGEPINVAPSIIGLWFLRCGENDYKYEPCAIVEIKSMLFVDDLSLGKTPVDIFHNGITDPEWLRT